MTFRRYAGFAAILLTVALTMATQAITAQSRETFKARLSALPADARTRAALAGSGSVTATLEGTKLSLTGSFEGLVTPATTANLHDAVAAGVRGPAIADLMIVKATSGMITGSVDLTPPQVANLHKGGLYVEVHSEKAPDGAIWGWFLK